MKIGIVGWGLEGQSAYKYFGPDNDYLIVNDQPLPSLPQASNRVKVQYLDSTAPIGVPGQPTELSYLKGIEHCDLIVYQPTAQFNLRKKFGKDQAFWSKAKTIQHIFYETVKTQNIIGITGTKGKGTTSTLIYELLKAAGKKVWLGGNIGTPVLDFVKDVKAEDWVVLELSNFQLYDLTYSPHIGVCLMITPEHMDWHPDMADYIEAKSNLFRHQKSGDFAIYLDSNEYSKKIANHSMGQKIPFYKQPGAYVRDDGMIVIEDIEIISKAEIKLLGEHNLQNVCAACTAVYKALGNLNNAKSVLTSFSGLEHRLEFVRDVDGVNYFDDSFGTTPLTAIVAMKAFIEPKVIILGGWDKGAEFNELAEELSKSNVKHAIVIGQITDKIVAALKQVGYDSITTGLTTMPEMVKVAREKAVPGDIVLLSAAASSFGLFKDYKDRGNQFKQAVQSL